ncbi:P-loop containing nucleoside triphosphate hydrolase protein [Linderina pennispora]|uniref:p-loop containing nucleoside triphosphate hydrolase protein n=1 Tax=Linderina pennispora TaxID=61395 RepID=A0A1Y1W5S2_9FUNG|nr:P-loop containing nucleoside triphosphate hydrolase protein [Linderina pennispora]ORX68695.1 P-loop containing nucleoside triphosphate hydrolase protein [Linderina pennispora]
MAQSLQIMLQVQLVKKIAILFNWDRAKICNSLPYQIYQKVLGALYALNVIIHGAQRMPMALTVVLPTAAAAFLASQMISVAYKRLNGVFYSTSKYVPLTSIKVIADYQEVMRIQGVLGIHLRVCASRIANYSNIVLHNNLLEKSTYTLDIQATMVVKSAMLLYQVEMVMRLVEIMLTGIKKVSNAGHNLKQELPLLSKYFVYTGLPREAPTTIEESQSLQSWPTDGTVEFRNYSMRYRENLDTVLNDISFSVGCKEKVGIVGRTGAGKSSLTYALLRLIEPAGGSIFIDGVDISTIGLQELRSKISIIPQDPALFSGTIRENLDPLEEFTDDEIWTAIRKGHMEDLVDKPTQTCDIDDDMSGPWVEGTGLDKWVEDDGKNFSVGQCQLVSLCRALLWERKILVLDEATANVDTRTDQTMQHVIREEFKDCTILTIAHRLRTVMDNDRILVMDQGRVAEFDTPVNLLAQNSLFKKPRRGYGVQ